MHGPYHARIQIEGETLVASADDLRNVERRAEGFYRDASPALAEGALRCGVFYAAVLIGPGQEAEVEIVGYEGSGSREREQAWHRATARRDSDGRFWTSLGSRFNERVFVGV